MVSLSHSDISMKVKSILTPIDNICPQNIEISDIYSPRDIYLLYLLRSDNKTCLGFNPPQKRRTKELKLYLKLYNYIK